MYVLSDTKMGYGSIIQLILQQYHFTDNQCIICISRFYEFLFLEIQNQHTLLNIGIERAVSLKIFHTTEHNISIKNDECWMM